MRVKELIERLQEFNDEDNPNVLIASETDANNSIYAEIDDCFGGDGIKSLLLYPQENGQDYDSTFEEAII